MNAKKQPAGRISARSKVKAKAEVPSSTQPAAGRRAAEAQVSTLIDKFTPGQMRPVTAIRRALRKRLPTACEIVYEYRDCFVVSYSPSEHGYEGVLALRGSADDIRLYLTRGTELPDPARLLRSSGGQTRWIELEGASALARPEVARLIEGAIALNRTPFPKTGRGPVVIRTSAAKPRRKSRAA